MDILPFLHTYTVKGRASIDHSKTYIMAVAYIAFVTWGPLPSFTISKDSSFTEVDRDCFSIALRLEGY